MLWIGIISIPIRIWIRIFIFIPTQVRIRIQIGIQTMQIHLRILPQVLHKLESRENCSSFIHSYAKPDED